MSIPCIALALSLLLPTASASEPPVHPPRLLDKLRAGASATQIASAHRLAYVPNDPRWPDMWHHVRIRADEAWDTDRGDPSVRVAIIDTGIEVSHPDLATNIWTNPGEIGGNGIDDDGNGYVDDLHGYDFAYDDPDPDDQFGHGTSCAGIIAAVRDNSLGVTSGPMQTLHVNVAQDTADFVDHEGTIYVEITTDGAGPGAKLSVDSLRLRLQ